MENYDNTSIYNEIDAMIKDNTIYHIATEMTNINDTERKAKLLKAINKLQNVDSKDKEMVQKKREQLVDNIERETFKKQWGKLKPFQKETKIVEYIEEKFSDNKSKKEILIFLKKCLSDGLLKSAKDVIYDNKLCKITSISKELEISEKRINFKGDNKNSSESDNDSESTSGSDIEENSHIETKKQIVKPKTVPKEVSKPKAVSKAVPKAAPKAKKQIK